MRVHRDEDVASHIGPEPCGGIREGVGEASAGECTGQPSSRESKLILGADAVPFGGRQYLVARERERCEDPAWSQNLACAEAPCAGTGRSPARPPGRLGGPYREGAKP